ncbi:MAG: flavodoxin domain-containing protein [Thermodesulfovibrionales bacterium]|nr:flavodoxin domain-containing protein [Thermodesulfovibrionales bacterium]
MKTLIVTASRYGSTEQIGRWIAERLKYEGFEVHLAKADETESVDNYELVIMGSGLYSHSVLPELKGFIEKNLDVLKSKKNVLFCVAMKTTPVFYKGKIHGGLEHLTPQIQMLNGSIIHADMLHGEMVPSKMTEKDREGLMRFYKMLNFSDDEIQRRLKPRTLMDKKEVWEFTETIISKLNGG